MTEFTDRWHEIRERKHTNIIAGLDPALFDMGRGDEGLPKDTDVLQWSLAYVKAVAPYVAGIKPNQAYFQGIADRAILKEIIDCAKGLGLLTISDNKVADIGSTNDAWFYYQAELGFDVVTIAPYAGNIEDSIRRAKARGLAAMTMGLMSNPEFKTEMNFVNPDTSEKLWHNRVRRSLESGVDGLVAGGTFTKENSDFMEFVHMTAGADTLYLVPGIGFQGGSVEDFLATGIDPKKCMINVGRSAMFPKGSHSTPEEQAASLQEVRDSFNLIAYGK